MCFRVYAIKLTYHSTTEAILLSTLAVLLLQLRAVGTEGRGSRGRSPPNFDRSVKPIPIRRSRLCPPHYYLPPSPRIFKPSHGPWTANEAVNDCDVDCVKTGLFISKQTNTYSSLLCSLHYRSSFHHFLCACQVDSLEYDMALFPLQLQPGP